MIQVHLHGWKTTTVVIMLKGEKRSVYGVFLALCALRGPPLATIPTLWRGHATQALMGFQRPSRSFSIQQTLESASHRSLVLYQVLTTSMLPINPIIYYVKQTKARIVNWKSWVRKRCEWKQILFKRLLDVARFINLFPKFSCQDNIWQKRIAL